MKNVRIALSMCALLIAASILLHLETMEAQEEEWELQIAFTPDRLINEDKDSENQSMPYVAVYNDVVFVVWQDTRGGTWDIYSRTSYDGGATFAPEVQVDDTLRTPNPLDDVSDQIKPRAVFNEDGDLFVVWVDNRDGRNLIFMGVSDDMGKNFSSSVMIDESLQGVQNNPDIAIDGSEVYVVWQDTRDGTAIYFTRTTDGENFDASQKVSDAPTTVRCQDPTVSAGGGAVHVAWSDDRNYDLDVYVSSSYDGGSSFEASLKISRDPSTSDQFQPSLASNDTHVYCVYTDMRYGSADIFMTISRDVGRNYEKEFLLNAENSKYAQNTPRASINTDGNLSVVWTSSPGFYDSRSDVQSVMYTENGTVSLIATVNDPVSNTVQQDASGVIDDEGTIHVAWTDMRRPKGEIEEEKQTDVYYSKSTASGEEGYAPVLDEARVTPELGTVGDRFTFVVRYSDVEGDEPDQGQPQLHLFFMSAGGKLFYYPGAPFSMFMRLIPPPDMDYRNGEHFIFSLAVERGLDLYYQFGAVASRGNRTEVRTPLQHLPTIDTTPPTFSKVYPGDDEWITGNIINFVMNISDTQSGVDPFSVGYRLYRPDQDMWTSWQNRGQFSYDGLGNLIFTADMTVANGKENKVIFRAKDMVGNGGTDYEYALSDTYSIWVDIKGPVVNIDSPVSGTVLRTPEFRIESRIIDPESGLDTDSIEVSYKLDGSGSYSTWMDLSQFSNVEILPVKDGYFLAFDLQMTYGTFNFVRIRAKDLMGNQGDSGEVQLIIKRDEPIIVDRPPSAVETIQPRVTGSVRPHITWTPSFDPEGDLVIYKFRIVRTDTDQPFVDWILLQSGLTYWDPPEGTTFEPGFDYRIDIIPTANGLDGPMTSSIMTVSTDANMPPPAVTDMEPKATGEARPVLRWAPVVDPEGDEVFYFIRIWKESAGRDLVPWTSVVNSTSFRVPVDLTAGVYYVNILCSDGTDFSPMATFTVSIGVFSPRVTPQRYSVVVYQDSSVTINLTIENRGFLNDRISILLDGEALNDPSLEVIMGKNMVDLVSGGATNVSLSVRAADFAGVGFRSLNVTVTSSDGISSQSRSLSIRVVDPKDIGSDPNGVTPNGESESDYRPLIYVLIGALILIILGLVYAFIAIDRRQREEEVEVVRYSSRRGLYDMEEKQKLKGSTKEKNLPP
ncbi:MAG: hypothetical protein QCI82_12030 [Candidatus Thermoplasmatota archaeon]|nr:hypothetical protein [Candidatus Thermoplasmatota archaeon]